ncbi:putative molybdenum carrier protein [Legionella impletisoli]|uniref:Molybdenum carrier n=1 Tax=Legionella impletisoli TaxID=343510 RepID=A0A917JUW7_9GAMM|nr:putative molybdenum carrier protein [Legionella impletisoli]GGI82681.1 hypothetical protein GCM10007966_09140 [Legionella impletisoli]
MIEKIVSGGQTGVDQAALLIASELGLEVGGWCPKGGLDENGDSILEKYESMEEASTSVPDERTKLNIRDSDGTLIIVPKWPLPERIKDGTILTIEDAKRQEKPYFIVDLSSNPDIHAVLEWATSHDIKVLNIGGPRESNSPGIYEDSCALCRELFAAFKPRIGVSL